MPCSPLVVPKAVRGSASDTKGCLLSTIKASADIERVFQNGQRFSGPLFTLLVDETPEQRDQSGRVAFAAGKKLGNAVVRNRCKRVMREAVRRNDGPWAGHDVVLIARRKVATADMDRIDSALQELLIRSSIVSVKDDGTHRTRRVRRRSV